MCYIISISIKYYYNNTIHFFDSVDVDVVVVGGGGGGGSATLLVIILYDPFAVK